MTKCSIFIPMADHGWTNNIQSVTNNNDYLMTCLKIMLCTIINVN